MKKLMATGLLWLLLVPFSVFGQTPRLLSLYAQGRYGQTIYDRTKGNNPAGMGVGAQALLHVSPHFKPTAELTADFYLLNDKVLRLNPDGTPATTITRTVNAIAGLSYQPGDHVWVMALVGPSFIGDQTRLAIKPAVGIYFGQNQRWMAKAYYLNVFKRDKLSGSDFGSIGVALGIKLF